MTKSELLKAGDLVVKGVCQAPRLDNPEVLCQELLSRHPGSTPAGIFLISLSKHSTQIQICDNLSASAL